MSLRSPAEAILPIPPNVTVQQHMINAQAVISGSVTCHPLCHMLNIGRRFSR